MGAQKYEILGTLGSGATGTVYLANEPALDRRVAYKELAPSLAADPIFLERFRGEARVMASLDHPNCVRVFDFFEEEGRAVLVSEYVPGASLRQVAEFAGHLTPEQALGVVKGALKGLAYAHGIGLVHRDIKPENLLADEEGTSKLADFGQALVASGPGAAGGMPAGSPAYMSPEMAAGGRVDLRTDIYSCGAMLFEFLTGRPAFTGDNPLAVMRKHINDPVPDPRSLNSDLPEDVGVLVKRAMAKDPEDRQRTAEQFLDELEAAAVAGYGADWEKRSSIKKLVAAAAAALGLLLVGGGAAMASTAAAGEAVLGAGISRWAIAGGVAAALVVLLGVIGLASGLFGKSHSTGGGIALTSPTPSASASPSPTDSPSPSPSPSDSPSPSPSPSPSLSPSPTPTVAVKTTATAQATTPSTPPPPPPASPTYLSLTRLTMYYETCNGPGGPGLSPTCSAPMNATTSCPAPSICSVPQSPGGGKWIRVLDEFYMTFSGGGSRAIPVTVTWNTSAQEGGPGTYGYTVAPPSALHSYNQSTGVYLNIPAGIQTQVSFTVTYTDDQGNKSATSATSIFG
ncbi:MAG: serine/threonine-protein kinase [Candidatus Dormibacteria bacterium]